MTRLTDRHKTIPYFKRVLVSSDTWGRSSTVDSHISRLRKKLECAGAPGMPDVMRGVGYRLLGVQ
ncbi:winged helix-turn-helix domain-containing protein [Burkholderia cenocepacia]|uniref:winged helix-turn-helix domain-containing protein n=1 Tax=Burkholderia cenocepacia TaxID=95486 RepID=UPI0021195B7F|nr:winged helix-turn-helix domain-containing protein [Burkholderia cenocepacia]